METLLTPTQGYILLVLFAIGMIALAYTVARYSRWNRGLGFLIANRNIGWGVGAMSIAASWIWAPALFVSVQKSYELGLAGTFWFTAPNVAALIIFAFLAPRIRRTLPNGFTLPDWIRYRFPDAPHLHSFYLVPYVWYQVMAITVQIFVGGMMLNYLTGIDLNLLMIILLVIALSYSIGSGLSASVTTDVVQMALVLVGIVIVIPMLLHTVGFDTVRKGLGGTSGSVNIFNLGIVFSFGLVTSIGLIAGAISDQQYWQRAFSIKQGDLVKSFVLGGCLFGIVPVLLSTLGFVAAAPEMGISLPEGTGLPMIGVATVAKLLPNWVALVFVIMLLGGLCSTLDSGMCAAASLFAIDIAPLRTKDLCVLHEQPGAVTNGEDRRNHSLDTKIIARARVAMIGVAVAGLIVALIVQHLFSLDRLWWIFNGVAVCFIVPTVMSLFFPRLSAKGVTVAIGLSSGGMLVFIYGNWIQNDQITLWSTLFIIVSSFASCIAFRLKEPWCPDERRSELDRVG